MDDDHGTSPQDAYVSDLFGVDPALYASPPAGDAGSGGGGDGGGDPAGAVVASAPAAADPTGAGLKILSAEDAAKCNKWMDDHFDASQLSGRAGNKADDYRPTIDGSAASLSDAAQAMLPLTMVGGAAATNPGLGPLQQQMAGELVDLASQRYDKIVAAKIAAAGPNAQPTGPVIVTIPPRLQANYRLADTPQWIDWQGAFNKWIPQPPPPADKPQYFTPIPKADDTPNWKRWADAFDDFCKKNHIDPKPITDTIRDQAKAPDDGQDSPLLPHQGTADPTLPPAN